MKRLYLNEGEHAAIIRALPDRVSVDTGFGGGRVWLIESEENMPAIRELAKLRGIPIEEKK